jgi:hypothetical protein
MIELIVSVCLIDDAARCKDVRLNFMQENVSARECMFTGQIEIAKWSGDHPEWRVARWQCGRAGLMAKA